MNFVARRIFFLTADVAVCLQKRRHIYIGGVYGKGIVGKSVLLNFVYVALKARRQRQDKSDTYYAYAARKGSEYCAGFFGEKIFQRQRKCGKYAHRGFFARFFMSGIAVFGFVRVCVFNDFAVKQPYYSRRIAVGKIGVVGYHYYQAVFGYFFEKLHYLNAGFAVQSPRGFVGKYYFGIVYYCTGNRHSLHLTARKLIGKLVKLISQPHSFKRVYRPFAFFFFGNAGKRQRKFDVAQYGLMRDKVIALENKAYRMIAVVVPVAVFVLFCGNAVYEKISARVFVEPADNIEHGGFAAPARAQDGNEFAFAEREIDPFESVYFGVARNVVFNDVFKL